MSNSAPGGAALLFVNFLCLLTLCGAATFPDDQPVKRECQRITIPMCKGIGYNLTYMPNQFNHETQEEAGLEVHQFWPLVEISCSKYLKFFLCSMYAPLCVPNYDKPLPVCRHICRHAKDGCVPLMRQYGFPWPEKMNCDRLPEKDDKEHLCVYNEDLDKEEVGAPKTIDSPDDVDPSKTINYKPPNPEGGVKRDPRKRKKVVTTVDKCQCSCNTAKFVQIRNSSRLFNKTQIGGEQNCAMSCRSPYLTTDEQNLTNYWIGVWSILCCISALVTAVTFLIDMGRFQYPERPIGCLAFCYFMVSSGYIIRIIAGHEAVSCDGEMTRYNTTGPALCTIVFLLIYLFSMCSCIWWVILSLTWFMAAALKWSSEAIAGYSQYFHIAAWAIPSIKSVIIIAMSSVDGDTVGGVCFVGNQSLDTLRGFVLIPLCIYLFIGTSFLLLGFVSLFRIRSVIKQQGNSRTAKLERLMVRIGVYGVLYTVPMTVVIACYFYEQHYRDSWERSINCPCMEEQKPAYSVYMLKYFMSLIIGTFTGFWIWSSKTIDSWKTVLGKLCGIRTTAYKSPSRISIKYPNQGYQPAPVKPMPLSHV